MDDDYQKSLKAQIDAARLLVKAKQRVDAALGPRTAKPSIRVFICHSSLDRPLADALSMLIRIALRLSSEEIRCTSVDGHKLPGGADVGAQLRHEACGADAFVGIISSDSLASSYAMFELGARWGAGRRLIPLLAPGTDASSLPGPLAGNNALHGDQAAELHQLVTNLSKDLSLERQPPEAYQKCIETIVAIPPRRAPLGAPRLLPSAVPGTPLAERTEVSKAPVGVAGTDAVQRPAERVFADIPVHELLAIEQSHIELQSRKLIEPFLGKWLHVQVRISDVTKGLGSQVNVYGHAVERKTKGSDWPPFVACEFGPSWEARLAILKRGDILVVAGQIKEVEGFLVLAACDLVEKNP